jgi:hypothetical protein
MAVISPLFISGLPDKRNKCNERIICCIGILIMAKAPCVALPEALQRAWIGDRESPARRPG